MRSMMAFVTSVSIIGAVALTTSSSANAGWDWGGMGYNTAGYRDWTHRYLGFQWGAYGWTWGLPIRYRIAPSYYPFGYPNVVPGCRC
jgi:hypothetical protein